ncbi:MAG: RNA methyltransferase, partial [Treponema sp.]|nr:RNA methyltransferase [Treponema sp.]
MKQKSKKNLAVCGYKAVKTLANTSPEKILRFYYTKERSSEFGMLCKKLAENKIPYNQVENNELEKLSKSLHHQGLVAFIAEPEIEQLSKEKVLEFMRNKEKLVFLDLVGNSNNFGAIIRSAAFFGIRHIIIPENEKQASIATSTYRVAQGGMEFVSLYFVKSPEFF